MFFRGYVNFNPLPPHGGRPKIDWDNEDHRTFQSTPSTRRETSHAHRAAASFPFQSTPSTRRETCQPLYVNLYKQFQSTPSTRRETCTDTSDNPSWFYFNPLPPHGGRQQERAAYTMTTAFQSTPSTRRETTAHQDISGKQDISIHSLHTEGDAPLCIFLSHQSYISIHSLHTEGDP